MTKKKHAKHEKEEETVKTKKSGEGFFSQKNYALIFTALGALIIGVVIGILLNPTVVDPVIENPTEGNELGADNPVVVELNEQEVYDKVKKFLDESFFEIQGGEARISELEKVNDYLYSMKIEFLIGEEVQGEFISYVTPDNIQLINGTAFNMDEPLPTPEPQPTPEPVDVEELKCENMEKVDETHLDAFVVSYCPFGVQLQRMALELPEDLKDNVTIRYIGSVVDGKVTAMHGEPEATENHRQICLREEQPEKFYEYLSCFIKEGDLEGCLTETTVDTEMLTACMEDSERGIAYAEVDFALQDEHGVSSSPTSILNGVRLSEYESSIALEKTMRSTAPMQAIICCSSTEEPVGCTAEVPLEKAATSFWPTYLKEDGAPVTGSC